MSMPRKSRVNRICELCGKGFDVWPSAIVHGRAKFCSRSCLAIRNTALRVAARDPVAIFWSRVDQTAGEEACWPYIWRIDHDGYGYCFANGKKRRAHAYALEQREGPPTAEKPLCLHSCDNPVCCNPNHLRWGTQTENVADRVARKRSRSHGHKINVPEMMRLRAEGWTPRQLQERYSVSDGALYCSIARAEGRR